MDYRSEVSEMPGLPAADRKMDVSDLVRQAQAGNRSAFGSLVEWYGGQAFAVAHAILRDRHEAEDAVQEAFIKAFQHIVRLEDPGKFGPWLRSIVRQECCGLLRRCKRRVGLLAALTWERIRRDGELAESGPGRLAYRREVWERCICTLSDRAREIVILHYMEGLSCEEIADLMGISDGTVKSHLFKARRKMEARLRKLGINSFGDL